MTNNLILPKSDTKTEIIEVALKLFYTHGVHWVSFKQIADQVKISQPAIYKHFKDKDDLMVACILKSAESGRQSIDQLVKDYKSPQKKLYAYLKGNLIWVNQHREQASMLLAMYYFAHTNAPLKEVLQLIHKQSVIRIQAQLSYENQKKKSWRIENEEMLARSIHSLLIGEMIKTFYSPNEMNVETRTKSMIKFITLEFWAGSAR